jgi:hypothetical protein
MLKELSPMTPFHLKLYYLLTEKNTGAGQNNQMSFGDGLRVTKLLRIKIKAEVSAEHLEYRSSKYAQEIVGDNEPARS